MPLILGFQTQHGERDRGSTPRTHLARVTPNAPADFPHTLNRHGGKVRKRGAGKLTPVLALSYLIGELMGSLSFLICKLESQHKPHPHENCEGMFCGCGCSFYISSSFSSLPLPPIP